MAESVLLVHDDIATIATVRRLLAREGYEVILATSVADALIAFGHHLPVLIILAPGVESGRGHLVLEELGLHPDMRLARVLLLGEPVPGSAAPVAPLPLDGPGFMEQVAAVIRSPSGPEAWYAVKEDVTPSAPEPVPVRSGPPGLVPRSSAPGRNAALEHALFDDLPKPDEPRGAAPSLDAEDLFSQTEQAVGTVPTTPPAIGMGEAPGPAAAGMFEPDPGAEAESLFGQTEQAVAGSAQVPARPGEDELRRAEVEVRRESSAQRRLRQEEPSLPTSSAGLFARTPAMGSALPTITAVTPVEMGPVTGAAPVAEPLHPLPSLPPVKVVDIEAEARAEAERLAQLEIEAALAREREARGAAEALSSAEPRKKDVPRLGEEGFFDVEPTPIGRTPALPPEESEPPSQRHLDGSELEPVPADAPLPAEGNAPEGWEEPQQESVGSDWFGSETADVPRSEPVEAAPVKTGAAPEGAREADGEDEARPVSKGVVETTAKFPLRPVAGSVDAPDVGSLPADDAVAVLEVRLMRAERRIAQVLSERDGAVGRRRESEHRITELETLVAELQASLEKRAEATNTYEESLGRMQRELEAARASEASLRSELERLKQEAWSREESLRREAEAQRTRLTTLAEERGLEASLRLEVERQLEAARAREVELEQARTAEAQRRQEVETEAARVRERDQQLEVLQRQLGEWRSKAEEQERRRTESERRAASEDAARAKAEARAEAEQDGRAEAEARAEVEEARRAKAEARAEAEQASRAKAEARAEAEQASRAKAEARAEAEQASRAKAEARAEAEQASRAKAEARAEAEQASRAKAEARAEAEQASRAKAEARAEAEQASRAEAEARAEAEQTRRAEAEARAEAEQARRTKAEARAEAEQAGRTEAQERAEAEGQARAQAEARAEAESRARVDAEARIAAVEKARAEAEARAAAEKKARAEVEARSRSNADARVQSEMKARTEAESRAEAADAARSEAEARAEVESRARARAEQNAEAAEKARARADERASKAERERTEALGQAEELERARVDAETRAATSERLRIEVEARVERLEKARATSDGHAEELERARVDAETRAANAERQFVELEARAERLEKARAALQARVAEEKHARTEAEARAEAAEQAHAEAQSRVEAESGAREELTRRRSEQEARLSSEVRQARAAAERLEATLAEEREERERLSREVERLGGLLSVAQAELAARTELAEQQSQELAQEREERERLAQEVERLEASRSQSETELSGRIALAEETVTRVRAETAAALAKARAEAEELAARARAAIVSIQVPGKFEVDIPRSGSVNQEGLARLVTRLQEARAQVRLELKVAGALRILWLKDGALVGAVSSAPDESFVDRARADGLIDARQENELRLVRGVSTGALIDAMRGRGYLRENEVVPLVQRYTEQVALDALGESSSLYRLTEEPPPHEVALAASTRPLLHLLAESLRNGVSPESFVEAAGGLRAVVVRGEPEPAPEAFGLSSRELRLLAEIDGEQTLEQLLLGAGMPQDTALKVLAVARALGLVTLRPAAGVSDEQEAPGELDVRRLESKFEEIQDADYFTVLGLSRAAGSEEVRRAFELLTAEFHPLRFAGHPDPALQHRAQQISNALSEAARALTDDRLREEYARSLMD
ncbi:hypothetical protein [Vitiosangium sp. GDMCC 1.1324]|uniref:hypothetical protein n=1 Tax=Vitiosangium sp. (strain GDMCC 1.1324) TaxID=2138576 RepID=UPI000D3D5A4F|nr:hypothetical protein [Vitiosangium sp. GDMCC 1.1324]PTL79061.1 hypothetical protein DAT35_36220 [Vitiosangium sp. GDMCC 1.1324]